MPTARHNKQWTPQWWTPMATTILATSSNISSQRSWKVTASLGMPTRMKLHIRHLPHTWAHLLKAKWLATISWTCLTTTVQLILKRWPLSLTHNLVLIIQRMFQTLFRVSKISLLLLTQPTRTLAFPDIPIILHPAMKRLAQRYSFQLNITKMVKTVFILKQSTTLQSTTLETRLMRNSHRTLKCSSQHLIHPMHQDQLLNRLQKWHRSPSSLVEWDHSIWKTSISKSKPPNKSLDQLSHHLLSQMEAGNATSARTTTSRVARLVTDARRPRAQMTAMASQSTWSILKNVSKK